MRIVAAGLMLALGSKAAAVPADFGSKAAVIMAADAPATGPGISAAVSDNGVIVWQGASGKANVAAGTALTPASLFRYASITKQFTAALILKLSEDGRLSLDDTLGKLMFFETPTAWHAVTVRQLLNHTSGIPSYTSKPGWMTEANTARPITTQQLIDLTRDQPLDFAPGSAFRYNNSGYALLSAIAEKLTGKPWYAALRERITGPLGLSSIRCGCEPGMAVVEGHTADDKVAQRIDMSVPSGAGALVGTAADLARWAAALHGGKVLKPATYRAMITPNGLPDGASERYAYGLTLGEVRGLSTVGHNGGIFGFNTESLYAPDKKLFVAVLSNSDSREPEAAITARRLLASAAGTPFPELKAQAADLKQLAPFVGLYKAAEAERRFFIKDGKLYAQRGTGEAFEVYAAGNDRFFYGPRSLSYFTLSRGAEGTPVMTFHGNGAEAGEALAWAGPVPPEAATVTLAPGQLDRLVGSFAMGQAVMTIARNGNTLTGQLSGQPPIPLEPLSALEFRPVGIEARLVFEEQDGKVTRAVLHQNGRTLPFVRQ